MYIPICIQTSLYYVYKYNYLKLNANTNMHYTHTTIRCIHSSIYPVNYVTQSLVLRPFSIKCNLKPRVVQKPGPYHLSWSMFHADCCWKKCIYNIE